MLLVSISAGLLLLVQQAVHLGVDGLVVRVELKQLLRLAQELGQVLERGTHAVVIKVRLLERRVHALALLEEARHKELEISGQVRNSGAVSVPIAIT